MVEIAPEMTTLAVANSKVIGPEENDAPLFRSMRVNELAGVAANNTRSNPAAARLNWPAVILSKFSSSLLATGYVARNGQK